jgi:hypothetical protein
MLTIAMTSQQPLPVAGYTPQSDTRIALVNEFKQTEERLLRKLDQMQQAVFEDSKGWYALQPMGGPVDFNNPPPLYDENSLRQAREQIIIGFMLLNRAVFQPQRIKLPEDGE